MHQLDQRVIDHCASHKLCRGCKFNCVAPVADWKFDEWIKKQERLVLDHLDYLAVHTQGERL